MKRFWKILILITFLLVIHINFSRQIIQVIQYLSEGMSYSTLCDEECSTQKNSLHKVEFNWIDFKFRFYGICVECDNKK